MVALCCFQVSPPSAEIYNPVFADSTIASRFCGADGASVNAILPNGFTGNPFFSFFQVFPPSTLFHIAEPCPPELKRYGNLLNSQVVAYTTSGLFGSSDTSAHPAFSLM